MTDIAQDIDMKNESETINNDQNHISDASLRKKIGQIIGFSLDPEISIEDYIKMLKDNGRETIVSEIEKTIKARN